MLELLGMPDWGYVILGLIGLVVMVIIDRKVYGKRW